jgi:hypothetical protein
MRFRGRSGESIRWCKYFMCRKIEIKRIMVFLKSKVGLNILPMSRVFHNCSFLLTLALTIRTRVMTLLVLTSLKYNHSSIEFLVSYRLLLGSWLGTSASTIDVSYSNNFPLYTHFSYHTKHTISAMQLAYWDDAYIHLIHKCWNSCEYHIHYQSEDSRAHQIFM